MGYLRLACAVGQPPDAFACGWVGRKVRSSQGSTPANGRGFALKAHATDECHRKYTACRLRQVRVKRCGKSAPRFE